MPEGGKYISSRISVYDSNSNLNDLDGLEFESGNVIITVEGDNYTLEFNCIGKNGDLISGYYKGTLHFYDLSGEDPTEEDSIVTFQYEEALND